MRTKWIYAVLDRTSYIRNQLEQYVCQSQNMFSVQLCGVYNFIFAFGYCGISHTLCDMPQFLAFNLKLMPS